MEPAAWVTGIILRQSIGTMTIHHRRFAEMKKQIAICVAATAAIAGSTAVAKVGDTRASVVAAAQKRFATMDADKDGKVTMAELTTFMNARAADTPAQRIERRMKREDANGDGAITAEESANEAGARFDKQDVNRNGTIDADEVKGGGEG